MKRSPLLALAVLGSLLTAVLLARAAWPGSPVAPAAPRPALSAEAADPIRGPAGWHYRHTQPTHWRACLLQQ